jgi:hypothetical protein
VGEEFSPAEGVTITGDEGEAVYLIHELDDSLEPPQYRRENVAKPESSLNESQADLPPLEGNFADEANMADDNTAGDDPGDDRDEPTLRGMEEQMAEMREMMEENTRMTREMREEMMGDGENGDDMDGDGEDEDEDDEEENAVDDADEDERTLTVDGEAVTVADIRALREEAADADAAAPETTDRANTETDDDGDAGFGFASMED